MRGGRQQVVFRRKHCVFDGPGLGRAHCGSWDSQHMGADAEGHLKSSDIRGVVQCFVARPRLCHEMVVDFSFVPWGA